MNRSEQRLLDGRIALEVFGWRRWRCTGNLHGAIPPGTVILESPDWRPGDWVSADHRRTVGYEVVEDDSAVDPLRGHTVTPTYTSDWNSVQKVVRHMGLTDTTWTMFLHHLGLQLNRRLGVSGSNNEARGHEIWRSVEPTDICLAGLEVAEAFRGWRAQPLAKEAPEEAPHA